MPWSSARRPLPCRLRCPLTRQRSTAALLRLLMTPLPRRSAAAMAPSRSLRTNAHRQGQARRRRPIPPWRCAPAPSSPLYSLQSCASALRHHARGGHASWLSFLFAPQDVVDKAGSLTVSSLSPVVSHLLQAEFDDLWEEVAAIPPPWSEQDAAYMLNKHW